MWKESAAPGAARAAAHAAPYCRQTAGRRPARAPRDAGRARAQTSYPLRLERTIDDFPDHALERRGARNEHGARRRGGAGAERANRRRPRRARRRPAGRPAQQPQIPSKVDLVSPEPQWVKLCGKEQTTGRDACQTMRDFATSADQPPMISIQVFELQGEEKKKLRFMMLPIGMLLKPGFRVVVDKAEPIEGKYDMCFQNACTAEVEISAERAREPEEGPEPRDRAARSGRRPFGPRADLQHSAEGFRADLRRQADRSQAARAAAPGAAAAAAEEGRGAAQGARAAAAEAPPRRPPRLRLPLRLLPPRRSSNAALRPPPARQREATALRDQRRGALPMASAPFPSRVCRGGRRQLAIAPARNR